MIVIILLLVVILTTVTLIIDVQTARTLKQILNSLENESCEWPADDGTGSAGSDTVID